MQAIFPLTFAALLFCVGIYGVLARRNAVLVLMSVEMMLAAVTINLVAFGALAQDAGDQILTGQIFALFVIAIGAAEVGVGLAIILLLYRNRASVNIDDADLMRY
jgi:NADH:ubiquinone oxidoreductase subunit K